MKRIMTITELVEEGYNKDMLRRLARCEDAPEFSFTTSPAKTATRYFNVPKLEKYLERRQEEWQC